MQHREPVCTHTAACNRAGSRGQITLQSPAVPSYPAEASRHEHPSTVQQCPHAQGRERIPHPYRSSFPWDVSPGYCWILGSSPVYLCYPKAMGWEAVLREELELNSTAHLDWALAPWLQGKGPVLHPCAHLHGP